MPKERKKKPPKRASTPGYREEWQWVYYGKNTRDLKRGKFSRRFFAKKAYARLALHVDSMVKVQEDEDPIIFTLEDQGDVLLPHDDPLVISTVIVKHLIERIPMESGSFINLCTRIASIKCILPTTN